MKKFNARRITTLAALTAAALIVFLVESLFPPLFLPGAKMGLSNIFTLLALILLSPYDAIILIVVRTVLGSFFAGGFSSLMYSLPAGLAGVLVSILLWKALQNKISIVAISVASAVIHNITQNTVYCLVTQSPQLFAYLPWLCIAGILAGATVGVAVTITLKYLPINKLLTPPLNGQGKSL